MSENTEQTSDSLRETIMAQDDIRARIARQHEQLDGIEQDVGPQRADGVFSPSSNPNKPIGMDFGTAISEVIKGKRVTRLEWADPNIYLLMFMWGQINPEVPAGKYLSIHNANGSVHPLYMSDGDLLGDDWVVVV
jgi:hypothetical protein